METEEVTIEVPVPRFSRRDLQLIAGGLTIGVGIGVAVGFLTSKNHFRTKYQAIADREIQEMATHFREGEVVMAEKRELSEIIREQGYESPQVHDYTEAEQAAIDAAAQLEAELEATAPPEPVIRNIFKDRDEPSDELTFEWDQEAENRNRTTDEAYVISFEEFDAGEFNYAQANYTWFTGDEVLVDVGDAPIDAADEHVLLENMTRFGHGSKDPNVVYIRNESLELDIEVVRSEGKFAHEVLGESAEIRHSDGPRRRRQRFDDE